MPYIKQELRSIIDPKLEELFVVLKGIPSESLDGVVNYVITRVIVDSYWSSYSELMRAIGTLQMVAHELYRRRIAEYEDFKKLENGDVYQ